MAKATGFPWLEKESGSMKIVRVVLALLAVLAVQSARGQALAGLTPQAVRKSVGTIKGRVDARSTSKLTFLLDGVRVRPQIQGRSFTIKSVPPGAHTLSIVDGAANAGAHVPVSIRARSTAQVGTLALSAGGQIAGLVSKAVGPAFDTVEALAGVEVVAEPETLQPEPDGGPIRRLQLPARLVTVTDETGAYSFRGAPAGSYRVSVVVPGLEAGVEFAFVTVGRTAVADFVLREAIEEGVGTVAGAVTGPGGAAVVGALVTIYTQDVYFPPNVDLGSQARAAQKGKLRWAKSAALPRGSFTTLTDASGKYSLNVPSGYLSLDVYVDGLLPANRQLVLRKGETKIVDLALEGVPTPTAGSIEGRVTDGATGKPLAGARVAVVIFYIQKPADPAAPHPPGVSIAPGPDYSAVTDGDGRYVIRGVPGGPWEVQAGLEGYHTQTLSVEVTERGARLDFQLKPGG